MPVAMALAIIILLAVPARAPAMKGICSKGVTRRPFFLLEVSPSPLSRSSTRQPPPCTSTRGRCCSSKKLLRVANRAVSASSFSISAPPNLITSVCLSIFSILP
ncbi:hypothetical protein D3C84_1055580 [compost metagenome]